MDGFLKIFLRREREREREREGSNSKSNCPSQRAGWRMTVFP